MKKIYVIAGATASGKSKVALQLAEKKKGCVVNADSIQVYKDIPLLTARPSQEEIKEIPHYLYGHLDCYESSTVLSWLKKAVSVLNEVENPIVVGGTGMYIKALVQGINEIPDVDPVIREGVRHMPLEEVKSLVKECAAQDPQRLRRALEVQLTTGKTLSWFKNLPVKKFIEGDFVKIRLNPDRAALYKRCDERFLHMLEKGAIRQVEELIEKNPTGGVIKAIGFKEIQAFMNKEITKEQMICAAQQATRNYAKRQMTWFKHQYEADYILEEAKNIDI